jgi:hypothetical protein
MLRTEPPPDAAKTGPDGAGKREGTEIVHLSPVRPLAKSGAEIASSNAA